MMNFKFFDRWLRSIIVMLLAALAVMVAPAHAALIGISPDFPDITTNGSDINYLWNAGTGGTLMINGNAGPGAAYVNQTAKFFSGDTTHNICQGSTLSCNPNSTYSLVANFNASGIFTGGTLSVMGYVDGNTTTSGYQPYAGLANTGTLLTANLSGFGFNGSAGTLTTYDNLLLDFSIVLTGGDLYTAGYTGYGLRWGAGRVYSGSTAPYGGNWDMQAAPFTKSFSCGNGDTTKPCLATMDTYTPVPVPAAVWLFGSGLVGLLGVATRSRRARAG